LAKPLGDLDQGAGINSGLIWCLGSHPVGSPLLGVELVSRDSGTLGGTAAFDATHPDEATWRGLDLKAFDDYYLLDHPAAFDAALDGADEYTALMYCAASSGEDFGTFYSIPYFDDSWSAPFTSFRLRRGAPGNATHAATHIWSDSSTNRAFTMVDGGSEGDMWYPDSNPHMIGNARNGSTHRFYADGSEQHSETSVTGGVIDFNATGSSKMVIGTTNDQALQESLIMEVYFFAVWDRELSSSEISSLDSDPTQMFIT